MAGQSAKKVSLQTVGCRLNQYESEKMAADLFRYGFERVGKGEPADLYIINTCTVTHRADRDCRALIRQAARQNPQASIVVAGCYVDNDPALIEGMEAVDVIISNLEKDRLTDILPRKLPELFEGRPAPGCSSGITEFHGHNRAWIKASDGCNQTCSFCILPTVRGRLRNRAAAEIVDEINLLVSSGYREVVLTGINLGHYKDSSTQTKNLAALCRLILKQTDLRRIRISSVEPQTVRDELLEVFADSGGRICRHWHIPMQSGATRILRLMRRPYDRETYLKRISAAREAVEGTIIGADVIVGFPGETDDDFKQTVEVAETGLLDYLHVFSYSDRPGTKASQAESKVGPELIKERVKTLTNISRRLRSAAHQRQIGQILEVISEHSPSKGKARFAIADNYIKGLLPPETDSGKRIIRYRVTSAHDDHVRGEVVAEA